MEPVFFFLFWLVVFLNLLTNTVADTQTEPKCKLLHFFNKRQGLGSTQTTTVGKVKI